MEFKIKTIPRLYFHQLIEILAIFAPFKGLRKRQREVFSEILFQNYLLKNEEEYIRNRLLFDYKTKQSIMDQIGISRANLHNIYKELRQKGLLEADRINPKFAFGYMSIDKIFFIFDEGTG